ncbi:MAG: hypothetical protein EB164_04885 [Thaumarchaeota archaeon]|nr:hypothetical protein [Nitrososphaerota archaeon]
MLSEYVFFPFCRSCETKKQFKGIYPRKNKIETWKKELRKTLTTTDRKVGFSMILVSASLVVIALLYLSVGDDVLYSDRVSKEKQYEYKQFLEDMKLKQEETKNAVDTKNLSVNLDESMQMKSEP